MLFGDIREELTALHHELFSYNLVAWSSGNISIRDPETGCIVIKPSGVLYHQLTPESMVVLNEMGNILEGDLRPSVDTNSHLYIYRNRDDIHGIVHTHSTFATAFAAVGKNIPVVLTSMADQFGGPIPCSNYAAVGGEEIGKEVLKTIGNGNAVLLRQHGVFTVGKTGIDAVKSAVLLEDAAKTLFFASQLGELTEIPSQEVQRARNQYQNNYGQREAHNQLPC